MADTLKQIYSATALGGTELDDGEHTLLTTNSTTSFVIKDMLVNGSSSLKNTFLAINDFNTSDVTANATGSLIVPPSSTLKIKTTDYPFSFIEQKDMMGTSANNTVISKTFLNPDGSELSGATKLGYTQVSTPNNTEVVDVEFGKSSHDDKEYIFHAKHDMNSSQVLAATENGAENHTNTNHNVSTGSYDPYAFGYNSTYGHIAVQLYSTSLRYWPLNSSYTTPSANLSPVTPSNFGNGNRSNSYSNQTQSSYPYMVGAHNFIWYWRGNSYLGEMWAINLENGQDFFCNLGQNASPHYNFNVGSDANHMVVSYRPSDDRFIVWWASNGSTIRWFVISETATQMRAVNQTTYSTITKHESGSFSVPQNSMHTSYRNSNVLGFDINGNLIYHNSGQGLTVVGTDGVQVGSNIPSARTFGGATHSDDSRLNTRRFKRLSQAEATANNLIAPTFGIQLLGVRVTT